MLVLIGASAPACCSRWPASSATACARPGWRRSGWCWPSPACSARRSAQHYALVAAALAVGGVGVALFHPEAVRSAVDAAGAEPRRRARLLRHRRQRRLRARAGPGDAARRSPSASPASSLVAVVPLAAAGLLLVVAPARPAGRPRRAGRAPVAADAPTTGACSGSRSAPPSPARATCSASWPSCRRGSATTSTPAWASAAPRSPRCSWPGAIGTYVGGRLGDRHGRRHGDRRLAGADRAAWRCAAVLRAAGWPCRCSSLLGLVMDAQLLPARAGGAGGAAAAASASPRACRSASASASARAAPRCSALVADGASLTTASLACAASWRWRSPSRRRPGPLAGAAPQPEREPSRRQPASRLTARRVPSGPVTTMRVVLADDAPHVRPHRRRAAHPRGADARAPRRRAAARGRDEPAGGPVVGA